MAAFDIAILRGGGGERKQTSYNILIVRLFYKLTIAIQDDGFDDLEQSAKLFVENTAYKEARQRRCSSRKSNPSITAVVKASEITVSIGKMPFTY